MKKFLIEVTETSVTRWIVPGETAEKARSGYVKHKQDSYEFVGEDSPQDDVEVIREVEDVIDALQVKK